MSSNLQTKSLHQPDAQATIRTRVRYDRLARFYDRMESGAEQRVVRTWRSLLRSRVRGVRILGSGLGTGTNLVKLIGARKPDNLLSYHNEGGGGWDASQ